MLDPRLDDILQRAFKRDRAQRYQTAGTMLTALEKFIYADGYGPTNEKLALYVDDLFSDDGSGAAQRWVSGATPGLNDED